MQAYDMSSDHKPDLQAEKERIRNAGGYVRCGRVNGTLNMSRAIGSWKILHFLKYTIASFLFSLCVIPGLINLMISGDMELKQNKSLPAEKQIVTANPDICTVSKFNGLWICINM